MIFVDTFFSVVGSTPVGVGYDGTRDEVVVYNAFSNTISCYDTAGSLVGTFDRPGGSANDFDIDYAEGPITIAGVTEPAGTALILNGETGVLEIYAFDPTNGTILATLETAFGSSHIVGGSYLFERGTFFVVKDQMPVTAIDNPVAEIDTTTGAVLQEFDVDTIGFSVNFGDLDMSPATGDLYVVSSNYTSTLRVSPDGTILEELDIPNGTSSLSGLAFDPNNPGAAWVVGTGGTVTRLLGFPDGSPINVLDDATGNTLLGDAGNDRLNGRGSEDVILGLGGDDSLIGGVGNDTIEGGAGNDTTSDPAPRIRYMARRVTTTSLQALATISCSAATMMIRSSVRAATT